MIKPIEYIIDGQQRQIAIDDVFTSIKEVKGQLKNTSFAAPRFLKEINDLFKSDLSVFTLKLEKYSSIFSENQNRITNPIVSDTWSSCSNYRSLYQLLNSYTEETLKIQQKKLEQLIIVLQRIIKKVTLKDIAELYHLEKEFTEPLAIINECHSPFILEFQSISETVELQNLLTSLRRNLKIVLRFKYTKVYRDLRQSFRNVIRFLFKNMSDESGENSVLLYADCKQTSFTFSNQKTHDLRRNY